MKAHAKGLLLVFFPLELILPDNSLRSPQINPSMSGFKSKAVSTCLLSSLPLWRKKEAVLESSQLAISPT